MILLFFLLRFHRTTTPRLRRRHRLPRHHHHHHHFLCLRAPKRLPPLTFQSHRRSFPRNPPLRRLNLRPSLRLRSRNPRPLPRYRSTTYPSSLSPPPYLQTARPPSPRLRTPPSLSRDCSLSLVRPFSTRSRARPRSSCSSL